MFLQDLALLSFSGLGTIKVFYVSRRNEAYDVV
jgi:hypothetical protein